LIRRARRTMAVCVAGSVTGTVTVTIQAYEWTAHAAGS
jgi:hypothetical protein